MVFADRYYIKGIYLTMKFIYTTIFYVLLLICICPESFAQHAIVKGTVSSNSNKLIGVTVGIVGTAIHTLTDEEGRYHISNAPTGARILVFSSVGYNKHQTKVLLTAGDTTIQNVNLKENVSYLDEVVVTGVSRATEVRKNPIPIAVVSKKVMDQNVNTNVIDAIAKGVPGLTTVTTGPNISKPFIRGLGYNRVLTLYDGLRQEGQQWGDEHGIEMDQNGIARAEVVKGPASLAYGSDAIAGVINMIPHKPNFTAKSVKGDLTSDYHSNNGMFGISLGSSFKANDWDYTFRVSNKAAHSYQNHVDGFVYGTAYRELNLSAVARVVKPWGNSQFTATLYNNKQEIPDGSRDSSTRRFTRQVADAGDNIKARPIVPDDELDAYQINPLHQHIQHYRLYNISEFKVADGNACMDCMGGYEKEDLENM